MKEPDLQGIGGKAWLLKFKPQTKDQTACLIAWLIHGGWHAFWTFWMISVVHLRPIEGVRPANKDYPDAEYEVMIASLESPPGCPDIHPDPDDLKTIRFLSPLDFRYQFHGLNDELAKQVADYMVEFIIDGTASPDSDFRRYWEGRVRAIIEMLKRKR